MTYLHTPLNLVVLSCPSFATSDISAVYRYGLTYKTSENSSFVKYQNGFFPFL